MSDISDNELAAIKAVFRDAGCVVRDLDEESFEILPQEYPVKTHVFVNPYYLQLSTVIFALASGLPFRRRSKFNEFLNQANTRAKLVKFTTDINLPGASSSRLAFMASVKLVTGVVGSNYTADALNHLLLLWLQDIAELIAAPAPFGLVTTTGDAKDGQETQYPRSAETEESRKSGLFRIQLSSEVRLPKAYVAKFPNKCIVCHEVPDSTLKVAHNSQNPFLVVLMPLLWIFGWSQVEIPICNKCKRRYRLQRWGRAVVCFGLILVACWLILPHFKSWSPVLKRIAGVALVLLAISPFVLLEVLWPPYFDTTAKSDTVDYEFASAEYAEEFRELNEEKVLHSD